MDNLKGKELEDYIFEVDNNDSFIRLVIPYEIIKKYKLNNVFHNDVNLIGKQRKELSIDEIVAIKKYALDLYEKDNSNK